ncbi:MAG: HAMP domain-containing sensor histidine kinase [Cyanobacteriota bacterium]
MNSSDNLSSIILQNLGVGIYAVSPDMNLFWINSEIKDWFIGNDTSFDNKKCYEYIFSRDMPCNNCPVIRLSKPNKIEVSTIQLASWAGKKRQYRFRAKYLDSDQKIVMVMDVTDQFEIERMREDFVATLTHDLRTPLLAEFRTLDLLTKGIFGSLNEKQMEVLEAMLISNRDLLSMVKNLLEVYRYEAGAKILSSQSFDLSQLVEECLFELSPLAETKNIELSSDVPEILPLVLADKREIWRVLTNLIGNAIEYTQENGKVWVNISFVKDYMLVEVGDTGRGIPESELEHLFQRFSQGTSENISSGTGLGLYLSKQIVQAHNGKIWAESHPGKGSQFYFTLPINI